MYENLALLAIFVLIYSTIAGAIERTWISGPIVFTCFGLFIGPVGLDLLSWETDRDTGDTLALITWVIFGAAVVGKMMGHLSWPVLFYSVLSLTVIRMLPVFLALIGSGISTEGKLFMGWFGPRGLASIVFAVIVVANELPDIGPIIMTVACTIILSVIAHGITANPWARAYGKRRRLVQQNASSDLENG